jgi:hypothetical protein
MLLSKYPGHFFALSHFRNARNPWIDHRLFAAKVTRSWFCHVTNPSPHLPIAHGIVERDTMRPATGFLLKNWGTTPLSQKEKISMTQQLAHGPQPSTFSVPHSGNVGQEILDEEGRILEWTTDEWTARVICKLLNENEERLGTREVPSCR